MSITIEWDDGNLHENVSVAGEFTDWQPAPLGLAHDSKSCYAAVFEHAVPGKSYMYKFIVDGNWSLSPKIGTTTDTVGNENHVAVASSPSQYRANEEVEEVQAPKPADSPVSTMSKEASPFVSKDSTSVPPETVREDLPETLPMSEAIPDTEAKLGDVKKTEQEEADEMTPVPAPESPQTNTEIPERKGGLSGRGLLAIAVLFVFAYYIM